ncbi:hypothetical protein D3C81_1384250 [compost metagenome]
MAHAHGTGDETADTDRRDEGLEVLAGAPEQLVTVAVRVVEMGDFLDLAQRGLSGIATGDLHVGTLQLPDGLLEGGLAGDFPAAGAIAIALGLQHQHAVVALVHLQVQGPGGRRRVDHHAEHIGGIGAPAFEIAGQDGDIAQSTDIHRTHSSSLSPALPRGWLVCRFKQRGARATSSNGTSENRWEGGGDFL